MFKDSFKYYKSKCPPPDLSTVVDFDKGCSENVSNVQVQQTDENDNICRLLGVRSPKHWQVFKLKERPGLLFVKNPFTKRGQRYWIARCLRDYPKAPHAVNLSANIFSQDVIDDWWKHLQNPALDNREKSRLKAGMRWATLGYHHDWDTKVYAENKRNKFPDDLAKLSEYFADVLGFSEKYSAEATIVNFYPLGSTLAGHTDHSEKNLDAPLFSFSFGQTAIFLIGGKTKEEKPSAIFLKSGDIVIMSRESRLCYHAVPKILKTDVSWINDGTLDADEDTGNTADFNKNAKEEPEGDQSDDYENDCKKRKMSSLSSLDDTKEETMNMIELDIFDQSSNQKFWHPYAEYIDECRININVRQVLHHGESTL